MLNNRILTPSEALEEGIPFQIDRTGEVSYGRFWFYSLAEKRDKSLNRELRHFWVLSGVCSMSFTTPICCEFANFTNFTSKEELVEFELENEEFDDIRSLTEKLRELLKTID